MISNVNYYESLCYLLCLIYNYVFFFNVKLNLKVWMVSSLHDDFVNDVTDYTAYIYICLSKYVTDIMKQCEIIHVVHQFMATYLVVLVVHATWHAARMLIVTYINPSMHLASSIYACMYACMHALWDKTATYCRVYGSQYHTSWSNVLL